MGLFQSIKGAEYKVVYRGNVPTCTRCYCTPSSGKGDGYVGICQENDSVYIPLTKHIKDMMRQLDILPRLASSPTRQGHEATFASRTSSQLKASNIQSGASNFPALESNQSERDIFPTKIITNQR